MEYHHRYKRETVLALYKCFVILSAMALPLRSTFHHGMLSFTLENRNNKNKARGPIFLPSLLHTKEKTCLNFDKYGELLKYQLRSRSISNNSAMFVGFCNINVYHPQPPFHIYNVTLNAFIMLFV